MRQCFLYIIVVLMFGCADTTRTNEELKNFNEFLGKDKAEALDQIVESFHNFLKRNYPAENSLGSQTERFLNDLSVDYSFNQNWKFNDYQDSLTLDFIEKSSLRKELYLYHFENYEADYNIYKLFNNSTSNNLDIIAYSNLDSIFEEEEIWIGKFDSIKEMELARLQHKRDSLLYFNMQRKFLYGLAKFNKSDTAIYNYVEAKVIAGDISPTIMINGLLESFPIKELENPFLQRILVVELYYWFLRRHFDEK